MRSKSGIEQACEKVGGQNLLAETLGVTPQAVSLWVKQGYAPIDRVWRIAELTGVKRKDICDPFLVDLVTG
ncbi:Putative bacterial antitoxin YdaS [uncultured Caudovirales phage]|uniref:Bacterial antitoxin YdaS n=1 Tax=uncultured Caudovirales phage TaxID=2100421 RepID=A0A6J5S1A2_9CAUD|nr:Putative bacterial antitoxin YdaS [uncultured Caudovirales phage]